MANYFHNFFEVGTPLTAKIINKFCHLALEFTYWQKNHNQLGQEVFKQVELFRRHFKVDFSIDELMDLRSLQVIDIESSTEFQKIAEAYFSENEQKKEQRTYKRVNEKDFIVIHFLPSGCIKVRYLKPLVYLQGSQLKPLLGRCISYEESLELSTQHINELQTAPFTTSFFKCHEEKVTVTTLKGYIFRPQPKVEEQPLDKTLQLLYPLKSLEKHFIDTQSDPFYISMTKRIERAIHLLKKDSQSYLEPSLDMYEQGRLVAEEVFPDDKLLELLVKELGRHLVAAWQAKKNKNGELPWQKQQKLSGLKRKVHHL